MSTQTKLGLLLVLLVNMFATFSLVDYTLIQFIVMAVVFMLGLLFFFYDELKEL